MRLEMKKAIAEHDEVALAQVIDVARELGAEYPYRKELDQAEAILFENDSGSRSRLRLFLASRSWRLSC